MMLAVVLLAIASVAAADEQPAVAGGFRSLFEPRLAASAMRLGRIERELGDIEDRIQEAAKVDPQGFLDDINDRIDHAEAKTDHCDSEKEVRCGSDTLECVNTLLLCDGFADCHNGWDESAKTCSVGPAKSGNVFSGVAKWTSCRSRKDHPIKIAITGTYKANIFGARLGVKAIVSSNFVEDGDDEPHSFAAKGIYVYGQKKLALFPASDDGHAHLGVVCVFDHGNDVDADCVFGKPATKYVCGSARVQLQ